MDGNGAVAVVVVVLCDCASVACPPGGPGRSVTANDRAWHARQLCRRGGVGWAMMELAAWTRLRQGGGDKRS